MSTQFPNFHPSVWQVRVEVTVDKGYPCPWRNAASVINCRNWDEALDETLRQGSEWLEAIHEECDHHYIRYNRTAPGGWIVEVIDAQAICPKKVRVDCEVYVGGDPLGDDDDMTWYVASYRLVEEFGSKPEPDPEPEPEEEIFDAAMVVIERLGLGAEPEPETPVWYPETPVWYTEPEPEPIVIPIPTWDWIDTSVETEPEPEPDLVTYGSVWVEIETPQWSAAGSASFDLSNDAAEAAREIDELTGRVLWRLEDTLGSTPESNQRSSSERWGQPEDEYPWLSHNVVWDLGQGQLCRVNVDWEISANQSPRSPMIAEAIVAEPLWLGAIRKDGKVTVLADRYPQTIANWAKGALDFASIGGQVYISGIHEVESARKGNQPRGFYAWIGDLSAEGVRLI